MPAPAIKITEAVRATRLRRPFKPSVTKDVDIKGFRAWLSRPGALSGACSYQPRGTNPRTGRALGRRNAARDRRRSRNVGRGRPRAALVAKSAIKGGRDPHRERMASTASVEASRSIIPATVGEALDDYAKALAARTTPSEAIAQTGSSLRPQSRPVDEGRDLATCRDQRTHGPSSVRNDAGSQAEKCMSTAASRRFLLGAGDKVCRDQRV